MTPHLPPLEPDSAADDRRPEHLRRADAVTRTARADNFRHAPADAQTFADVFARHGFRPRPHDPAPNLNRQADPVTRNGSVGFPGAGR